MRRNGRVGIAGVALAAIAAFVLLTSGCGYGGVATGSQGDKTNGKTLFLASCGSCHTLQDANTHGAIGPNLDNAFAGARAAGYSQSTIENDVLDQIRLGSGPVGTYTNPEQGITGVTPQPEMPKNLVTGQNALDVAAYVSSVAGMDYTMSGGSSGNNGAAIFTSSGCGGCHTLKAAGSTGNVGPNLDTAIAADAKADHNMPLAAFVQESIANPSAYIAKNFSDGIMPAFKGKLTDAQIKAVAQYVLSSAGK